MMNKAIDQSERFAYIAKLEQEQAERNLNYRLEAAKRASKQQQVEFITSYMAAQTFNLVMASFGLCKRNGE